MFRLYFISINDYNHIYYIQKMEHIIMSDAHSYIKWINKKLKLNNHFNKNKERLNNWKVNRGQIYTCFLGENIGYEKSKIEARPCVIVSTKRINHESGNVIIVPFSKNIKYERGTTNLKYPYHYVLKKTDYPKLDYDSVVQCEDIRCVSKARLSTYICNVKHEDMRGIKKRLKEALQL